MDRISAWLLSIGVGAILGGGTYAFLVADPALAGTLALLWTIGFRLTIRHRHVGSGSAGWRTARWSGAFGGLVTLAATLGLGPTLPLPDGVRLAIGLLLVGVAMTAFNLGVAMVLDADRTERVTSTVGVVE